MCPTSLPNFFFEFPICILWAFFIYLTTNLLTTKLGVLTSYPTNQTETLYELISKPKWDFTLTNHLTKCIFYTWMNYEPCRRFYTGWSQNLTELLYGLKSRTLHGILHWLISKPNKDFKWVELKNLCADFGG